MALDAMHKELMAKLREVTDYLGSMPDAGLTHEDPRLKWYWDSYNLRKSAYDLIEYVKQ